MKMKRIFKDLIINGKMGGAFSRNTGNQLQI